MTDIYWLEPPWKMLLSNKGILPVLWEMYPSHPFLLAASFEPPSTGADWVRKPLLGRDVAEMSRCIGQGWRSRQAVIMAKKGLFYQDVAPLKSFGGMYPVIGSWVIGHETATSGGWNRGFANRIFRSLLTRAGSSHTCAHESLEVLPITG